MIWSRRRWLPLTVLIGAVGLLVASIVWTASAGWGPAALGPGGAGPAMMGPGGMMGSDMGGAIAGNGPVRDLDGAHRAAQRFADRWGLSVGEVMQFDNGFYAELAQPSGALATEVLIDPRSGAVQIEYGPAMMWNTAYGMRPARAGAVNISAEQAKEIADRWLDANRRGEHVGQPEVFPGYYTLHTLRGDQTMGMLSVNDTTGKVWYHAWHGRFIAMTEHDTR